MKTVTVLLDHVLCFYPLKARLYSPGLISNQQPPLGSCTFSPHSPSQNPTKTIPSSTPSHTINSHFSLFQSITFTSLRQSIYAYPICNPLKTHTVTPPKCWNPSPFVSLPRSLGAFCRAADISPLSAVDVCVKCARCDGLVADGR